MIIFLRIYSFDKSKVLCLVLHSCDVSHPAKRWDLHHQWTSRCMEEFFVQGDREAELGLEYSPLCDRHNTMVPQSQIGKMLLLIIFYDFNKSLCNKILYVRKLTLACFLHNVIKRMSCKLPFSSTLIIDGYN